LESVSQTRDPKPKGLFSLYGILCLTLAFLVCAWGTSYKLSLYSAARESSPAKVCTSGSDTAKSALDRAADGRTLVQARLSIAVFSALLQGVEDCQVDWRRDAVLGDVSPLNRAPILHLRPPLGELRSLT
jgi:hypothetical protein